jgi:hypothetical protein
MKSHDERQSNRVTGSRLPLQPPGGGRWLFDWTCPWCADTGWMWGHRATCLRNCKGSRCRIPARCTECEKGSEAETPANERLGSENADE